MSTQVSFWGSIKPRVIFIEDNLELNITFKKGADFELYMEQDKHYIIYLDDIYYYTFKEYCRKVS